MAELARAWVEQYSKSDRDRDDNFFAMMDYERELREEDPDKAIDLIVEILKIETNPVMLSLLAAGPLEDVISMETIDRIEREASANKRFHDLLGGVWYYRAPDELKARLDALVRQNRWWEAAAALLTICTNAPQFRLQSATMFAMHHDWITC